MTKIITHWEDARNKVMAGITKVTDAVKVTMGPKGRNVMIARPGQTPIVTNDWVTVAKEIILKDAYEEMGANMMKDVAEMTNREAGDGTTTTVVLTKAIMDAGKEYITDNINMFKLTKHLKKQTESIVARLINASTKIETREQIEQIATVSSQSEEIWSTIADAFEEMWDNWTITVEEGSEIGISRAIRKGLVIDRWYVTPLFITNQARQEAIIEKPLIVITNAVLTEITDIDRLLMNIVEIEKNKNILIIANNIEGEALDTLILTKRTGWMNVCVIKAPGVWDKKIEALRDIAIATWWKLVEEKDKLNESDMSILWSAERVIITAKETVILEWDWEKSEINNRIEELTKQMWNAAAKYDKDAIEKRIARLGQGISTIRVLAPTDMETENLKYKIEDALNATRSSIEEGFTVGWGMALMDAWCTDIRSSNDIENIAMDILEQATIAPARQIAKNAGYDPDKEIRSTGMLANKNEWLCADTWDQIDYMKAGIIDPVKVIRVALENAVSTATMLLTTEAVITEEVLEPIK